LTYQVDCSCYSGGSGGPIVDKNNKLIGVLFANLSFKEKDEMLQIPKTGVILSKYIIKLIIDNLEHLNDLWIFKLPDDKLDEYFNYKKYKPKF
jgi:hypothetical protein